jgi:HK97 gp10 family phage protein
LRSSIESVSIEAGKSAEVRVGAPYAAFVEFGTYKMAARPYLYPAFQEHAEELKLELLKPLI